MSTKLAARSEASGKASAGRTKRPQARRAVAAAVERVAGKPRLVNVADRAIERPSDEITIVASTGRAAAPRERRSPNDGRAIKLFQIYYEDWHRELLDPEFEPYDDRATRSELREFAVFEKLAESDRVAGAHFWGALSWRFAEKTGLSGRDWIAAVDARRGFDVYHCNPFPQNEALYHNVWLQGEASHPRFLELAMSIFQGAGLPLEELTSIHASASFAAGNYFVATPRFWEKYLHFVRAVLDKAERRIPAPMRHLLHSKATDPGALHFGATHVPFIVERLFTTFLATDGAAFKRCRIPLPARERGLNVDVRLLREMKDVACRTHSNWLAACWINYRNLYLNQTHGREWSEKHLGSITPRTLRFAGAANAEEARPLVHE